MSNNRRDNHLENNNNSKKDFTNSALFDLIEFLKNIEGAILKLK